MYSNDNNDNLAINSDNSATFNNTPNWVGNLMDWTTNPKNNNTQWLTSPTVSLLGQYIGNASKIFWCPADNYLTSAQRALGWANRNRSVAMDGAIGDGYKYGVNPAPGKLGGSFPFSSTFWWAKKMGSLHNPGPSQCWLFTDEHPDSIDDGILYTDSGANDQAGSGTGMFTELPAANHSRACGVSFADGHSELHAWQGGYPVLPVIYQNGPSSGRQQISVANDPDLAWLAQHTPQN